MLIIIPIVFLSAYLGAFIGHQISYLTAGFTRPKGLWNLVPFRVSGWKSALYPNRIYNLKWALQDIDLEAYYEEKLE